MKNIDEKFLKPYKSADTEGRMYDLWEKSGYFNPDTMIAEGLVAPDAKHFSIVLPPPNVTGVLHLGHAFENANQDALIRYHRMKRERTLWIPGTDHAAIATQSRFEKELSKTEKKSRHDYSRDEFFGMIEEFALKNQSSILGQLKRLGASLDWSRLCFTLDDERKQAVFQAFKTMYDLGLIYQKDRVVNWDPKGQTTISDDEIVREDRIAELVTFYYSKDCPIPIATTRAETKIGDTAIAVHPNGKWKDYIGQTFHCNFAGSDLELIVIGDDEVDPEFGTGALGVTPAHSITDWEISQRHNLPMKTVINKYGKMTTGMEGVLDQKTTVAREAIVQWLKDSNLFISSEKVPQSIATAERTGGIIEPIPMLQWWVNVSKQIPYPHDSLDGIEQGQMVSLKELMLHAVTSGQTEIIPNRFDKTYRHWIENLRDWNISRQIIFGHRVPVWYLGDEMQVSLDSPGDGWEQDTDTLDTWFSSGLWSFSTLGWPNAENELANYHPTSILNPGYEILPFWVARMILMSTILIGQVPFKTAYIHGMLRDKTGQKFSKSLNNGIDPIEVIDEYGTDALRMALLVGVTPGQDMNFDLQKVKAYTKFANKLWNISRFVLESTLDYDHANHAIPEAEFGEEITALRDMKIDITRDMDELRLYMAADKLYHYVWHEFADIIIEKVKPMLVDTENVAQRTVAQALLWEILTQSLKMLHPFMPFVTEEIWQSLPHQPGREVLMVCEW